MFLLGPNKLYVAIFTRSKQVICGQFVTQNIVADVDMYSFPIKFLYLM